APLDSRPPLQSPVPDPPGRVEPPPPAAWPERIKNWWKRLALHPARMPGSRSDRVAAPEPTRRRSPGAMRGRRAVRPAALLVIFAAPAGRHGPVRAEPCGSIPGPLAAALHRARHRRVLRARAVRVEVALALQDPREAPRHQRGHR